MMLSNSHQENPSAHLSPLAGRGRIALAIRVRGSLSERSIDSFKNARQISQHVIVPKPQDSVVVVGEPFIANSVTLAVGVLSAIDFHNQAAFATDKIYGKGPDWLLSDELVTIQPTRAKMVPEHPFRLCRSASQTPRSPSLGFSSTSHAETPPHPSSFARRPLPASGERRHYHGFL